MQQWLPAPPQVHADLLAFTPVPRNRRAGGWTVERQRGFIAALAQTGSVKAAARAVNMASEGAYALRRHPDGGSFAAAWAAAQASGLQRLTDIAIDRATEGVPVPVFYRGEQVGEKRSYNDRLLMFLMKGSGEGGARMGVLAPTRPGAAPRQSEEDRRAAALEELATWLDEVFGRYQAKVAAERRHRLAGEVVAADFTLRQLTHLELILDLGGYTRELIEHATGDRQRDRAGCARPIRNASPISDKLDQLRRETWASLGEPERPTLDLRPEVPDHSQPRNGDTRADREAARATAKARIASAQALWEAAATEESWARFRQSDEG